MKKMKWLMLPVLALITIMMCAVSVQEARADANLQENGSVIFAWINDPNDLRTYIDENGLCSSKDSMKAGEYSNVYKIIVDEPGQLVFAPLGGSWGALSVYSDFGLVSKILEMGAVGNSRATLQICHVEKGTYYYRSYNRLFDWEVSVFIGFIPDSGTLKQEWAFQKDDNNYEEVQLIPVSSPDELSSYVDHDGIPTRKIRQIKDAVSETCQFTVSEPGTLVIAPVTQIGWEKLRLFSDSDLSSGILTCNGIGSCRDGMNLISLQPGTYYFNTYNPYYDADVYLYLGFFDEEAEWIDRYATIPDHNGETEMSKVTGIDDLKQKIQNSDYTYSEKTVAGSRSSIRKLVLDETSMVYIYSVADHYNVSLNLYSDSKLISKIDSMRSLCPDQEGHQIHSYLLDPGEYYIFSYSDYYDAKSYVYLGYTPVSDIISVESIQLNDDKNAATVRFTIAGDYDPDQYKGQVRIEKGVHKVLSANNSDVWKEKTRENAIESHEFVATENGVYTARLTGNELATYLLTFEVTGINETTDGQEQQTELEIEETTEPAKTEASETMTPSDMRRYVRMLEDQIEDLGLELPDYSMEATQEEYMRQLEKVLHENGYDL